jgi:crossover junction endodeoxyribonuclease RuvC
LKSPGKNRVELKILGIDPGSIKCGYGLIGMKGKDPFYITSGTISASPSKPLQQRLKYIFDTLKDVICASRPDDIVVEQIFFAKGAKAALSLGHARGIVLLAAAQENINLHECSALEVKKAVVGYGRAEKKQVLEMVRLILNIREPLYPDSADALALALCHANTIKFKEAIQRS